jgi:protoporphyrinogen oxidase
MVEQNLPDGDHMTTRIGIIGGGMLGLGAAKLLAGAGHQVTVFEAADHVGGLADPWTVGDLKWDRHYHVISPADATLLGLIDDIGLTKSVHWSPTRTGAYADGKLYPVTTTMELLRYPPLRLTDKFRLALTVLVASRIKDASTLENVPIQDWLTKWSGRRAYTIFWKPLLNAKLGAAHETASAAFIWAIAHRLYAARRSGRKREVFGWVSGGYRTILTALVDHLERAGVNIRTSTVIATVASRADGVQVTDSDGNSHDFDQVLVTLPPAMAARLLPDLPSEERERLLGVSYLGVVCASMVTSQPVTDCYVTNLIDAQPFTGIIEMSSLIDPEQLRGKTLVYLPRYALSDDPVFDEADASIEARFIGALETMFDHFDRSDVEAFRVSRARYVIPRPILGYSQRLPAMRTSIPGVMTASTAHIVNGTQNVNEVLDLATLAVAEIESKLAGQTTFSTQP